MPCLEMTRLEVTSPRLPEAFDGLQMAVVSDVHFVRESQVSAQLRRCLARAGADVLLVVGDVAARPRHWERATRYLTDLLDSTPFPLGAFAVLGNHDSWRLRHHWSDPRLRFLRNESWCLQRGGQFLRIAGIEQREEFAGDVPAALASADDGVFTILLAHYPSAAAWVRHCAVDLMLSGHTHGGQICLPHIGPLYSGMKGQRDFVSGLHRVGDAVLYISRGIGYSGPLRMRLFCPPELPVITLRRGQTLSAQVTS